MKIHLDTLIKLNAYVGSLFIFLLVFRDINVFYSVLFAAIFVLSFWKDFKISIKIPRFIINILGMAFVFLLIFRISIDNLILPAVETLLILLSLKLLEDKKFRDYMQIYLLIVLIFAGFTLLSISMTFMLYLLILIFYLNFSIILLSYYSQQDFDEKIVFTYPQLKKLLLKTAIIPILSIPLMFFLFFALPRTNYPFLNITSSSKGKTGFSDNVKIGDVSNIQEDNSVAMRIAGDYVGEIYIRGLTYDYFDGKQWHGTLDTIKYKKTRLSGFKYNYTIYLEPTGDIYLFTVDQPFNIQNFSGLLVFEKFDKTFIADRPILNKVKYDGISYLKADYREDINKDIYLTLPKINSDIENLAKQLKGKSDIETTENIKKYLLKYKYSLTDLPTSKDPIYDFLFKTKQGNCEYFATSMALMLRINHIPSRVVAGYKTTNYNKMANYYIVKQRDAHLWVEAYIDGVWIRFDPTPPLRNVVLREKERFSKFKLFLDTLNYYYTTFIINYDFSKQMEILNAFKKSFSSTFNKPNINFDKRFLVFLIFLTGFLYCLYILILYIRKPYEEKLLNLIYRKLKKHGYVKNKNEGLEEFVSKIRNKDLMEKVLAVVKEIEKFIYKDQKMTKEDYKILKDKVKNI